MQNRRFPVFLFLCIATIGCYATIAQIVLIREFLNVFYGNELCLGIVFGAWFLGIATGAFAGAKIGHTFQHAFSVFIITLFIMCFVLPVQIFFVRGVRGFLPVGTGEYISLLPLLLTTIGLILPLSFIIGFLFPFSSRVVQSITTGHYGNKQTPTIERRLRNSDSSFNSQSLIRSPKSEIRNEHTWNSQDVTFTKRFARKQESTPEKTGDAAVDIGFVYIIESLGSLIGGLVFSFYLVSRFHPLKIITLLNIVMFVFLIFLALGVRISENKRTARILGLVSLGLALFMTAMWFSPLPDKIDAGTTKMRWNALNPHIELVASADSKHQHIDIGRQAEQYSVYLNGQYATAFPNEYEYAQITHLVMTQHPSPKHVLLIGNGLGGILSEMLLYPIETLDYVELDQKLLHIAGEYLSPSDKQALSDKRVTVFHQDGRYYIKNTAKKQHYDIILVNTPDPSTAFLNRFYTLEFFREVLHILKADGVVATSVSSAVTYLGKEVGNYTGSLYHTLHEAFRHVLVTPGQTNFYVACNKEEVITPDIETLMGRYRRFQVKSDYFTEYLFYTLLQPEQVASIENQLGRRNDLRVNTDTRPVTYFLNLVLWDSLTGGRLHGLFHGLQGVGLQIFLISIAVALAARIIYLALRRAEGLDPHSIKQRKANCLIALAITGFTGIALEIVLLYAFQNIYGYIYERMGVITSVFMVGLALGGYLMNQIIKKIPTPKSGIQNHYVPPTGADSSHWVKILFIMQGIIGFYALVLPILIDKVSSYSTLAQVGLVSFIGIAGILTGMEFPLVNKILIQFNRDIALSAGTTNGADHLGAFFGALLTGIIFVPLLGVFGTCCIIAVLNAASLVLISFSIFRDT